MMDKDKLRKADLFSGGVIMLAGLLIVIHATTMPMKDSWGGVQNVWYVSPAIFPLFVGAVIMLLGALLINTAIKAVGFRALGESLAAVTGGEPKKRFEKPANIRFFAILTLFVSFVFLLLPRVDFFLAATLFLLAFISMFYLDSHALLVRLFGFFALEMALMLLFFLGVFVFSPNLSFTQYPGDWLTLILILAFALNAARLTRSDARLRQRYRLTLGLSLAAPLVIGGAFKYLLLVPMPFEGLVVELLDLIWYFEF